MMMMGGAPVASARLAFFCCFNAIIILIYRSRPRVAVRGTAAFSAHYIKHIKHSVVSFS